MVVVIYMGGGLICMDKSMGSHQRNQYLNQKLFHSFMETKELFILQPVDLVLLQSLVKMKFMSGGSLEVIDSSLNYSMNYQGR